MEGLRRNSSRTAVPAATAKGLPGGWPALTAGPPGGQVFHVVGAAAMGARGEAPADHLPQDRQVRADAEGFLRAAQAQPKTGNHFVKDQQGFVLPGQVAQRFEKAFGGRHTAHVARHRLDDQGCDFTPVRREDFLHSLWRIERHGQRRASEFCGNSR